MNNPPAFPLYTSDCSEKERGMTLRDYFAAKAMPLTFEKGITDPGDDTAAARAAYQIADAMLAAREQ